MKPMKKFVFTVAIVGEGFTEEAAFADALDTLSIEAQDVDCDMRVLRYRIELEAREVEDSDYISVNSLMRKFHL